MWAGLSPALVLFLEMLFPTKPKNSGILQTRFSKAIELDKALVGEHQLPTLLAWLHD
jgi:hypothetical protein